MTTSKAQQARLLPFDAIADGEWHDANGVEYRYLPNTAGSTVTVVVPGDGENPATTVVLPDDPQHPMDNATALERARQLVVDHEAIAASLTDDDVAGTMADLDQIGYFRLLADRAVEIIEAGASFTLIGEELPGDILMERRDQWIQTFDEDTTARLLELDAEQTKQVLERAHRSLLDAVALRIRRFVTVPDGEGQPYRDAMTRSILTQARYLEQHPTTGPGFAPTGGDRRLALQAATLNMLHMLAGGVVSDIGTSLDATGTNQDLTRRYVTAALDELHPLASGGDDEGPGDRADQDEDSGQDREPLSRLKSTPIFDSQGHIITPSTTLMAMLNRTLNAGIMGLDPDPERTSFPTRVLQVPDHIDARLTVHSENVAKGWHIAKSLGPNSANAFMVFVSGFINNRQQPLWGGQYDGYISINDMMELCGCTRKTNRGWDPDDRKAVVDGINALSHLMINGWAALAYDGKAKRPKRFPVREQLVTIAIIGRDGMSAEDNASFTAGAAEWAEDYNPANIGGYGYRLGAWANDLREGGPSLKWLAHIMAPILKYPKIHQRYARNLGFILALSYRKHAYERSYLEPVTIRSLLRDADLKVVKKKELTTLRNFAKAMTRLTEDGVVGYIQYLDGSPVTEDIPEGLPRYWCDAWLDMQVVIAPPKVILETYKDIGKTGAPPLTAFLPKQPAQTYATPNGDSRSRAHVGWNKVRP